MHNQDQMQEHQSVKQETAWFLFPNGKMWRVSEGIASGTVLVEHYEEAEDLETRLDMMSEAATGSIIGLTDFGYEYVGKGLVRFAGKVEGTSDVGEEGNEIDEQLVVVDPCSRMFVELLKRQYGMLPAEAEHARDNLDTEYGEECVVPLANGREVRTAVYPEEASYVRVCIDGLEVAHWVNSEWREVADDVMGALIGAMRGSLQMA